MAHHGGPTTPTRRGEGRRACRARSSGMSGPIVGHVGPDRRACRARSSGMSGPIVGHVGPDRRACRARSSGMSGRSSGMSGPFVGHVGPDRRACRARSSGMSGPFVGHVGHVGPDFGRSSGRRLSEIALLGFHIAHIIIDQATEPFCVTHRLKREGNDRPLVLLHGKAELPTYSSNNKFLTTQEAINVLLDGDLQQDEICSQVPFSVSKNGIFIVDLNTLGCPKDILCDDMGVWTWSGSFKRWCLVSSHGFVKLYKKNISLQELNANSYRIWKRYYSLKASPDIRKMVILLEGI